MGKVASIEPTGLADELRALAAHASILDDLLSDVETILDAIEHGELLRGEMQDEDGNAKRFSAICLLDIARRKIAEDRKIPGPNLSMKLSLLADREFRRARGTGEAINEARAG